MKRTFFHIHIWKTGGTTFQHICKNNFGKGFKREKMLVQNWALSAKQLRVLLNSHKWIRCYSCHMLSGDLPYDVEDTEVLGLSFIRNPVDRLVSNYNYMMDSKYRGEFFKEMSFSEYYALELRKDNPWYRNGETYVLGGRATEDGIDKIRERMQQGRLVLLVTERFDESCIVLERLFPEDFKDCSYISYNISSKKQKITDEQRKAVSKYLEFDFQLLMLANDWLDTTLDSLFPNSHTRQQYLEDFRRRCRLKKRKQGIIQAAKALDRIIKTTVKKMFRFIK